MYVCLCVYMYIYIYIVCVCTTNVCQYGVIFIIANCEANGILLSNFVETQ